MTAREKFSRAVSLEPGAGAPEWEFAYWNDTVDRWYGEGLPLTRRPSRLAHAQWVAAEACPGPDVFFDRAFSDIDVRTCFGFDEGARVVGVSMGPEPPFPEQRLDEDEETFTMRSGDGKVLRIRKDGRSMPAFLDYPVKNRDDWEQMKTRFDPGSPGRFADGWHGLRSEYAARSFPLQMGGGNFCGFFSILREMLGLERVLYSFYDEPDWMREMLGFFEGFYCSLYEEVLADTDVDYVLFWEDMCFRNGPLVSPRIFRELISPCYRRTIDMLRARGVTHFFVDTDGNPEALLPAFIEAGVNGMYPFEVQSCPDLVDLARAYPGFVFMGGIDKKALAAGPAAIDRELQKARCLLERGGYIPYTDHAVPPDVPFGHFTYYRKGLKKLLGNEA